MMKYRYTMNRFVVSSPPTEKFFLHVGKHKAEEGYFTLISTPTDIVGTGNINANSNPLPFFVFLFLRQQNNIKAIASFLTTTTTNRALGREES